MWKGVARKLLDPGDPRTARTGGDLKPHGILHLQAVDLSGGLGLERRRPGRQVAGNLAVLDVDGPLASEARHAASNLVAPFAAGGLPNVEHPCQQDKQTDPQK